MNILLRERPTFSRRGSRQAAIPSVCSRLRPHLEQGGALARLGISNGNRCEGKQRTLPGGETNKTGRLLPAPPPGPASPANSGAGAEQRVTEQRPADLCRVPSRPLPSPGGSGPTCGVSDSLVSGADVNWAALHRFGVAGKILVGNGAGDGAGCPAVWECVTRPPGLRLPGPWLTVHVATEGVDRDPFTCPGGLFSPSRGYRAKGERAGGAPPGWRALVSKGAGWSRPRTGELVGSLAVSPSRGHTWSSPGSSTKSRLCQGKAACPGGRQSRKDPGCPPGRPWQVPHLSAPEGLQQEFPTCPPPPPPAMHPAENASYGPSY